MDKETIHVFDVDGTLTRQDSFILLIRYLIPSPSKRFLLYFSTTIAVFPSVFKGQLWKLKQAILSKLWTGQQRTQVQEECALFFEKVLVHDLRKKALDYIHQLRNGKPSVQMVLLSASCEVWLLPLAHYLQADLICTELAFDTRTRFTGRLATPNCKGPEKVRRLLEKYPADRYEFLCYADSASDKPLQNISRQFFYRYF